MTKEVFESVRAYFKKYYPELVDSLDNPGAFWPGVNANTIPNERLREIMGTFPSSSSMVNRAAFALAIARLTGRVANPE